MWGLLLKEGTECRYPNNRSSLLGPKPLTSCLWKWGDDLYKILYPSHRAEVLVLSDCVAPVSQFPPGIGFVEQGQG